MSSKDPRSSLQAVDDSADAATQVFYQKREKIYVREVHGLFALLRVTAVVVLLGLYYGLPWLQWDGRQALLFDLPARKFYIFDLVLWPQDFFYLAVLLMIAALSLFFFTALAGRLWCGYACPQTVWTEIFMWIERKIEGDRPRQMKLDKLPWNREKILKKGGKHLAWLALAGWTGFTFVGYFTPILELGNRLLSFDLGPWETFWVIFYGFATYGNAGWMREQVCLYMCPYARFQSAMFDDNTLVISYDENRGEPRGSRKKGADHQALGLGDCIDCTMCVQVCPTGIDIRDGLQYECIGCAACIDVCDDVMDKMGYPKGLIRYTTENALQGESTRMLRPRVLIYAALLLIVTGALVYSISQRTPLELDIIRDRSGLYRETSQGLVENVYTLKIVNMDEEPHVYRLSVEGIEGLEVNNVERDIRVPGGEVYNLPMSLAVDPVVLDQASNSVYFTLQAVDEPSIVVVQKGRFMGPVGP
ncbi:MAG: cytochrome c oxidase accessory protein CcoG [Gammaproteobacteria bacterium]|nr:cytochrome c oxidase accessory protein CcoG [Gammaproteobacteria bacterium]